jgi:hypothetical protein
MWCLYRWEEKKRLYHLPKSQNNYTDKPGLFGNIVTCGEVQLGGVRPSWVCWMCHVDHPYPSHPLMYDLSYMQGELCILSAEEQFLCTQGHCHTCVHRIIIFIISNFISLLLLTLRKSILNLFRLSLCQFSDYFPWLSSVVFQLSLESLSNSHEVQSCLTITRTIWSEWTQVWWRPLELA